MRTETVRTAPSHRRPPPHHLVDIARSVPCVGGQSSDESCDCCRQGYETGDLGSRGRHGHDHDRYAHQQCRRGHADGYPEGMTTDLRPNSCCKRHGSAGQHDQPPHPQPLDELGGRGVGKKRCPFHGEGCHNDGPNNQSRPGQRSAPPPGADHIALVAVLRTRHKVSLTATGMGAHGCDISLLTVLYAGSKIW